jgi:hypothetical protein
MLPTNGLCECGCEQQTTIANRNDKLNGMVKGQPRRFILGHTQGMLLRRPDLGSLRGADRRRMKMLGIYA